MFVDILPGFHNQSSTPPISKGIPAMKVTGMPGKHIPDGIIGTLNDMVGAVSLT